MCTLCRVKKISPNSCKLRADGADHCSGKMYKLENLPTFKKKNIYKVCNFCMHTFGFLLVFVHCVEILLVCDLREETNALTVIHVPGK